MDRDALYRMLYVRREYTALMEHIHELQGLLFVPSQLSAQGNDQWQGIIFIRAEKSPWHRGAFAFTVTLPPKYPFECPIAEFDLPIASHPMLQDGGRRIPFESEYLSSDPMRVSIMMRLLKYIRRLFAPQEWKRLVPDEHGGMREVPGPSVDVRLSQQDVELRSVAQEIILSKPYVEYLTVDVREWIVSNEQRRNNEVAVGRVGRGDETDAFENTSIAKVEAQRESGFALWFTRSFLPRVRGLQ